MWADALQERRQMSGLDLEWPLGVAARCVVVHGFLSSAECDELIAKGERAGFTSALADYPPSYRDNDRLVVDDPVLAQGLFRRLMHCAGERPSVEALVVNSGGPAMAVNERMRFCRYRPGTQFGAHQDGVRYGRGCVSRLTFMVYLNDGSFNGGDTLFFANRSDAMAGETPVARLRPRKGSLILFDHAIWHAGARVEAGLKYVMRSDLMYGSDDRRVEVGPFEPGHQGYIWSLTSLSGQRIASAGRDAVIRIWDRQGLLKAELAGHTQSVLGVLEMESGELVSYSRDRTIRGWHAETGTPRIVGTSETAVLSADRLGSAQLVTGDAGGKLTTWDLEASTSLTWQAHESWIWAIAAAGDDTFATAAEDGWVRLWRSVGGMSMAEIDLGRPLRTVAAHSDPAGRRLAVGDIEGRLHILDAQGDLTLTGSFKAHEGALRKVRFEDDRHLLSCGEDGLVCRWDLLSGRKTVLAKHDNFASDVLCVGKEEWISCGYDSKIQKGTPLPGCEDAGINCFEPWHSNQIDTVG